MLGAGDLLAKLADLEMYFEGRLRDMGAWSAIVVLVFVR